MPLLLIPLLLVGITVYGAIRLYTSVTMRFGPVAGVAALALAAAAAAGLAAWLVHRHRFIHGKTVNGQRILKLSGSWGQLTLDANQKQGSLTLHDSTAHFIFADIAGVTRTEHDSGQAVTLRLDHAAQPEWHIPLQDARQARRWARILDLAAEQKL